MQPAQVAAEDGASGATQPLATDKRRYQTRNSTPRRGESVRSDTPVHEAVVQRKRTYNAAFLDACKDHGLAAPCSSQCCSHILGFKVAKKPGMPNFILEIRQKMLELMCLAKTGCSPPLADNLSCDTVAELRACRSVARMGKGYDLDTLDLLNRRRTHFVDVCATSLREVHLLVDGLCLLCDVRVAINDRPTVEAHVEFVLNEAEYRGHIVSNQLDGLARPLFLKTLSAESDLKTLPLPLLDACLRAVFDHRRTRYTRFSHIALGVRKVMMQRRLIAVGNDFPTDPAPSYDVFGLLADMVRKAPSNASYFTSCAACGRLYKTASTNPYESVLDVDERADAAAERLLFLVTTPSEDIEGEGRWTHDEHTRLLRGLELFGKNWTKVTDVVGSRTNIQVRSHAQKYYQSKGETLLASALRSECFEAGPEPREWPEEWGPEPLDLPASRGVTSPCIEALMKLGPDELLPPPWLWRR